MTEWWLNLQVLEFQPDYMNCEYSVSLFEEKRCQSVFLLRSSSTTPLNGKKNISAHWSCEVDVSLTSHFLPVDSYQFHSKRDSELLSVFVRQINEASGWANTWVPVLHRRERETEWTNLASMSRAETLVSVIEEYRPHQHLNWLKSHFKSSPSYLYSSTSQITMCLKKLYN